MWQPKFPTAHGDEGKISYWLNKLNYFKVKFQYVICLLWRGRWLRSTSFMYPIFLMCFMQLGVCWNAKVNWKIWINKLGLCMIHSGETQRSYTLFQVCGFFFSTYILDIFTMWHLHVLVRFKQLCFLLQVEKRANDTSWIAFLPFKLPLNCLLSSLFSFLSSFWHF